MTYSDLFIMVAVALIVGATLGHLATVVRRRRQRDARLALNLHYGRRRLGTPTTIRALPPIRPVPAEPWSDAPAQIIDGAPGTPPIRNVGKDVTPR